MIIPIDDCPNVFSIDLMDSVKTMLILFTNIMCIVNKNSLSIVLMKESSIQGKKPSSKLLQEDYMKACSTYLTILTEKNKKLVGDIPSKITTVLEEVNDVMPLELQRMLLSKRVIDYKIKLKKGI